MTTHHYMTLFDTLMSGFNEDARNSQEHSELTIPTLLTLLYLTLSIPLTLLPPLHSWKDECLKRTHPTSTPGPNLKRDDRPYRYLEYPPYPPVALRSTPEYINKRTVTQNKLENAHSHNRT